MEERYSCRGGVKVASYPGPRAERGRGPGDTWQNCMCSVSIMCKQLLSLLGCIRIHAAGSCW